MDVSAVAFKFLETNGFRLHGQCKDEWCADELSCIYWMHLKAIIALIEGNFCQLLAATISGRAQNFQAHVRLHVPHTLPNDGQNSRIDQAMDNERYVG
jgi:hypothetical protein